MMHAPVEHRRRKRGQGRRPPIERRTHIALADLIRRMKKSDWIFLHVPNGEYRTDETAALLQRMGVLPGVFDFLFISPIGEHCWLELKRDWRAEVSIEQLRFRRELQRRNIPHAIARSFDEAVACLKQWGVLQGVHVQ